MVAAMAEEAMLLHSPTTYATVLAHAKYHDLALKQPTDVL